MTDEENSNSYELQVIGYELKLLRFLREAGLRNSPQLETYIARCKEECNRDKQLQLYLNDDSVLG